MSHSWKSVKHITDGEAVKESVASRPSKQLENNTEYLKDIIDGLGVGSTLIARNQPIDNSVLVGQPVYPDNGTFKQALAQITYDSSLGTYVAAASGYVMGVLYAKTSSTRGDILISGYANLDISNAVDGTVEAGAYYLSSAEAGKLTKDSQLLTVYVLYSDGAGNIVLNATPAGILNTHAHYMIDLYATPAGTPNCPDFGERMEIVSSDASKQGWLPANHPSFSGLAPSGAKFGYNLDQHPELLKLFPPIPLNSIYVEFNGKDAMDLVQVDMNGIWWMADCVGYGPWKPWDASLGCSAPSTFPTSLTCDDMPMEILEGVGDPADYTPTIRLWITRYSSGQQSLVTSLQPSSGSPILITDSSGNSATIGDLYIDLDLELAMSATDDETGYKVVKSTTGKSLERGPVVESIKPGSSAISIASEETRADGTYVGNIQLDIDPGIINGRQGDTAQIALYNAESTLYNDIPAIEFPQSKQSYIRATVMIPETGISSGSQIQFSLWLLAPRRDVLPTLKNYYRRLSLPSLPNESAGNTNEVSLVTSDTALTNITPPTLPVGPDAYILQQSDKITIAAGDLITYKLQRDVDSYAASVVLLRLTYRIFLP